MVAQRGQPHEAQHGAGAQPALQAVGGVAAEVGPHPRQAGIEEAGGGGRAGGQRLEGRGVRLLQDLRVHLGEDARVGHGDGQQPRDGVQPQHLQEHQRPEQLVDGAHEGAAPLHRLVVEDEAQPEARHRAQRHPGEGEGHRHQQRLAQRADAREAGGQGAQGHAAQLAPRVDRGDLQVREEQQHDRGQEEGHAGLEGRRVAHPGW